MSRSRSDADLLLSLRDVANEASSAVPSVVGSRHGRSSRGYNRHSSAASSVRSRSFTGGSRSYTRSGTSMTRSSTSGGPLCMTLEENQKHVQDAAFDRYMQNLQREAKEAVDHLQGFRTTVQGGFDEDLRERQQKRQAAEKNQAGLMEQMELNKGRRADLRREYIQNASAHSFPLFTETFIDLEEYERIRKEQKDLWRKELDQQKATNDMLRNIEERKARDLAEQKHRENISSMTKERAHEYKRLADQGRDMVNSWERDVRIKALKKQMENGLDVTKEVAKQRVPQGPGYMKRR